jgi:asparagine N-glycosylation enzyme membrane subunit Stt3
VPVLRGRSVPVRVPVVAGGLVAVVLLAASPAMIAIGVAGLASGDLFEAAFLLVFPTLPWGLALAAAVTAYALRRRGTCAACGRR